MGLRDLCQQYNIRFKKGLGQNLLLDDNVNRIMVEAAALTPADDVVEVGAGLGALTERLASHAGRVLAIEIDDAFIPCLRDRFGHLDHVRLFHGDVLNHPLPKLLHEFLPGGGEYKMVSNLPYYITSTILFHFWEAPVHVSRMVVMVQEEVAKRMTADVGTREYGALSLAARLYADVDIVRKVPRTCFAPRPNVDSCIVRLRARKSPLYPGDEVLFVMRVVRAAFAQRRKTLRNSLTRSGRFGAPADAVAAAMAAAGIDPGRRPQTVTVEEFGRLAHAIRERIRQDSSSG